MSDFSTPPPPPPPPPPAAPPPPPAAPPSLFQPSTPSGGPIHSRPLQRVGRLSTIAIMLSGGSALAALGGALASRSLVGEAEAFLAGTTDKQQFVESIVPFALLTVIQLVLWVAAAAVVMTWMFRIAANHRVLHRGGTWGPAWGIGGWFLPPMLYVIPLLMIRELWKAADPGTPVGSEWRGNRASPITVVWFVIYSVIPLAIMFSPGSGTFSGLGNQERAMAEGIAENSELTLFAALVSIAGAVVFAVMARQLTARHQQLTGELLG